MENLYDSPLVSVIIPVFNTEKYVARAIESLIDQTYKNIELLVINDGSTDNSHDEIMRLADKAKKRFRRFCYRRRKNSGQAAAMNEGLEWAEGKYFSSMDSDDIFCKPALEELVLAFEGLGDKYAAVFGDAFFIGKNGEKIYVRKDYSPANKENGFGSFLEFHTAGRNIDYTNERVFGSYETLLSGNYLPNNCRILKTGILKKTVGWTNGCLAQDWGMWLNLSKEYKFLFIDKPLSLYRIHGANVTILQKKKIVYDSIDFIKRNKDFAFKSGLNGVYYETYVRLSARLMSYSLKDFLSVVFKNMFDFHFIKTFFKLAIHKYLKILKGRNPVRPLKEPEKLLN